MVDRPTILVPIRVLDGLVNRLDGLGMDTLRVSTRIEHRQTPLEAIVDTAAAFDTVVTGESDPTLSTFVFGMPADQVAERFLGPVVIVQRDRPDDSAA